MKPHTFRRSALREYRVASWRVVVVGGAAAGLLAVVATGLPPSAQAASGGVVHVYESGSDVTGLGQDVFTGAFTDYGVDHAGIADNGNINKIVLSKGSFEVNVAKLDNSLAPTSNNQKTCTLVLKGEAPTTLLNGTGAYAGISGTITVTEKTALIFPKLSSGKCNESQTAKPLAGVYWVSGEGTVSLS
jgi:hypothetical protein